MLQFLANLFTKLISMIHIFAREIDFLFYITSIHKNIVVHEITYLYSKKPKLKVQGSKMDELHSSNSHSQTKTEY